MAQNVGCPCAGHDTGRQFRGRATGFVHSGHRLHARESGFDMLGKSRRVGRAREVVIGATPFTNIVAFAVGRTVKPRAGVLPVDIGGPNGGLRNIQQRSSLIEQISVCGRSHENTTE